MTPRALILLFLLSGCSGFLPKSEVVTLGTNYNTFAHPFTEEGAEDVRLKAEKLCAQQKLTAIKTQSVCSLTKCNTTYQCTDPTDATLSKP